MNEQIDQDTEFVFVVLPLTYRRLSDIAMKKNLTVPQLVSCAVQRILLENQEKTEDEKKL